jgi:hypothetical protein
MAGRAANTVLCCAVGLAALTCVQKSPVLDIPNYEAPWSEASFLDHVVLPFMSPQSKYIAQIKKESGSMPPMRHRIRGCSFWAVLVDIVKDLSSSFTTAASLGKEKYDLLRLMIGIGLAVLEKDQTGASCVGASFNPGFQQGAF